MNFYLIVLGLFIVFLWLSTNVGRVFDAFTEARRDAKARKMRHWAEAELRQMATERQAQRMGNDAA